MGYTTVLDRSGAVTAAALLAEADTALAGDGFSSGLLVDQLMAEAGIVEPHVATLALDQADGDLARACSLIRAWSAVLPRVAHCRVAWEDLVCRRRITPGFAEPAGGQYLGASRDYAQRLLDLRPAPPHAPEPNGRTDGRVDGANGASAPASFPRAAASLDAGGLVARPRQATPTDVTRAAAGPEDRGALLQLLSRAETGALVALGYTGIRGNARQDPTLLELRVGTLPVRVERPGGGTVTVGQVPAVLAEIAGYRLHGGQTDRALTLGVGATPGRLERRAVAAGVLDGACARAAQDPPGRREPCEDPEFLSIALDGQEASGFVEHLKLPHHVTFTSELDRVRQSGAAEDEP